MAEETKEDRTIATYQSRDGQEIKLSIDTVRKFLVSGKPEFVTDQEIVLYIGMCKARGLNPFKKDCYLVKYTQNDAASTIVSIDYYRARARAQPDCRGWQCGVVVKSKDGKTEQREGSFTNDDETLVGGWFRGKPAGWDEPLNWSIALKPYVKTTREGAPTRFWSPDNQPAQIAKVAESQGLRRLWPDEFQGLYTADEMDLDITPEKSKREVWKESMSQLEGVSHKAQLEAALQQAASNSNDRKQLLKELTGCLFMSSVTEEQAKKALEDFAKRQEKAGEAA